MLTIELWWIWCRSIFNNNRSFSQPTDYSLKRSHGNQRDLNPGSFGLESNTLPSELPCIGFNSLCKQYFNAIPKVSSFKYSHSPFQDVEDIDLFVGGLAERPLTGAVVGPTFGCLLGQQFQILKKGDRFWYENNIPPSAYTKGKKAKLQNKR